MRNFYILVLGCMLLMGCKSKASETRESKHPSPNREAPVADVYNPGEEVAIEYEDGEYCATINYHNPSTGTSSTYTLEVEVENGELVRINWPNGGWLDSSHFDPPTIGENGSCSFTTYEDKEYEVYLESEGSCSISSSSPDDEEEMDSEEDIENEVEEFEETSLLISFSDNYSLF